MTPDQWRAAGHTFRWRGLDVFYRDEGNGPPLVLLHGFPTSSWDWAKVWPELVQSYRVIALDYIGFGFSAKPASGPYSIFSYADQVDALIDRLGIPHLDLLAHDLGDTVAQELLARDRERTARFTTAALLNGGILPELHRPRLAQKILNSPLGFLLAKATTEKLFTRGLAEVFGPNTQPSAEELAGYWQCARDGVQNFHLIIRYIRERKVYRDRWVSPIVAPRIPTCFIDGHRDPVSGKHVVEGLRALAADVEIYDLPDIGHYPQAEAPHDVLRAYATFRKRR